MRGLGKVEEERRLIIRKSIAEFCKMASKVKPNAPDCGAKRKAIVSSPRRRLRVQPNLLKVLTFCDSDLLYGGGFMLVCFSVFSLHYSFEVASLATKWMNESIPDDGLYSC